MKAKDLRNSILQLAIQGKLVPQNANDEPASELLKQISAEKKKLIADGVIKKEKDSKPITDDEKPFEIPDSWEWVRLGEIGICQTGTTPSKQIKEYYGNKYQFIKPDNILENNNITKSKEFLSQIGIEKGRLIKKDSILMVCIGSIGKVGIINEDCSCNQQINSIEVFNGIYNKYILYVMSSFFFQNIALNASSKTTLPILNKTSWENLPLPLPPLAEQQRIVEKIEELETYIQQYDEYETKLTDLNTNFPKEIKKSILQYAIQGKLVPQNANDEPANELLKQISAEKKKLIADGVIKKEKDSKPITDDEKPFEIPESWEWVRLENIIYNISTKPFQIKESEVEQNGKYPVVSQSKSLIDGYSNIDNKLFKHKKPVLIFGDHTRNLKYIDFDFIIGADGTKILCPFNYNIKYLYYCIQYFIINMRDRGYSRHYQFIKSEWIPLPPLAEQQRIVDKIEKLEMCINRRFLQC